jgi:methylated-DNA-[protein]-cysteine S-methyltransferase
MTSKSVNANDKKKCQGVEFHSRCGPWRLEWSDKGITSLTSLKGRTASDDEDAEPPAWVDKILAKLRDHFEGKPVSYEDVPLDLDGVTDFRRKVYDILRQDAGWGKIVTYGELAEMAGTPKGMRAIGGAMANNPIPVIIPCHRVLAKGGIGGFSAPDGINLKLRLLALEGMGEIKN